MHIGLRIFFGFFLIVGLAALITLRVFVQEVKPGVREAMEDTLVDTAQALATLASDDMASGHIADGAFARFLGELAAHRRLALLPEVAVLYEAYKRESESQLLVKVTSAMALDAAQADQLKASLKRRFKREIELQTAVDPSLIGGVVIDTGSEVIDGSARGRLARLSSALAH